jgi:hypothetical protein
MGEAHLSLVLVTNPAAVELECQRRPTRGLQQAGSGRPMHLVAAGRRRSPRHAERSSQGSRSGDRRRTSSGFTSLAGCSPALPSLREDPLAAPRGSPRGERLPCPLGCPLPLPPRPSSAPPLGGEHEQPRFAGRSRRAALVRGLLEGSAEEGRGVEGQGAAQGARGSSPHGVPRGAARGSSRRPGRRGGGGRLRDRARPENRPNPLASRISEISDIRPIARPP